MKIANAFRERVAGSFWRYKFVVCVNDSRFEEFFDTYEAAEAAMMAEASAESVVNPNVIQDYSIKKIFTNEWLTGVENFQ